MSDNINKELVKNTFDKEYNREQFKIFIKELLNGIEERDSFHTNIPSQFKDYIKSYRRLGKYTFTDTDNFEKIIDVIEVNLKRTSSVEKARSMQRNFVARYLNGTFGGVQREACLVAFINEDNPLDWRFSLVKMDYKTEIKTDKDGNKKRVIVEELTPAKRFSFLVGKNENTHTAQQQLFTCLEKSKQGQKLTLEDLTNAFNIEKVSQEFFDKYQELFKIFCEELQRIYKSDSKVKEDFDKHNINVMDNEKNDFAKKTLGQLVFLYFIQKKRWLGVDRDKDWGTGDIKFLRNLFNKKYITYNNFFNDILEPLFYEALATDRGIASYFDTLKCRIPFLNGGLFEPINNYSWTTTDLTIKNELFEKIFDVFDLYNFTVKEDEPLEKEIAIDPEMLGKVFENLLPENIRKGNGAFYTPREIVHYMCQESLINYLDTQLNKDTKIIEKEDISVLVKRADSVYTNKNQGNSETLPKSIKPNAKQIDTALANIKICDPAIGSGAFPVGIMTEIVRTRMALNDYLDDKSKNRTSYQLKRNAIENSIYGVDLDSGAVEIAKLRFYLSLVVDEENIKDIRPLPNLDFKIMQGNSLISSYEGIDFDKILENKNSGDFLFSDDSETIIEEIKQNLNEYINVPYATKKAEIREEIENLMIKLIKNKLENSEEFKGTLSNFKNEKTKGIEQNLKAVEEKISNLIANRENRNFFPWKLFFADVFKKGGFDIIIGNPPYIGQKGHKALFEPMKKHPGFEKEMDYWYFFLYLGFNLLKDNAIISFITPNYWTTAQGGKKLRNLFINNFTIKNIINFNHNKIFSAGVHTNVFVLKKEYSNKDNIIECCLFNTVYESDFISNSKNELKFNISQNKIFSSWSGYVNFIPEEIFSITNKLIKNSEKLCDNESAGISKKGVIAGKKITDGICNLNQGIITGKDRFIDKNGSYGVFVLNKKELDSLKLSKAETKHIKNFYKNSDIKRYFINTKNKNYLIYINDIDNEEELEKNQTIYKHIKKYKTILKDRSINGVLQSAYKKGKWWALTTDRPNINFNGLNIVCPQRSDKNTFAISENEFCSSADIYYISLNKTNYDMKYILSILNSKLIYFWLYWLGKRKGNILELYLEPLQYIPIKNVDNKIQDKFIIVVDKILNITKQEDYLENIDSQNKVKEYEEQIDIMVYKLYELTYEEVLIIDKDFKLSKEKYNSFTL